MERSDQGQFIMLAVFSCETLWTERVNVVSKNDKAFLGKVESEKN